MKKCLVIIVFAWLSCGGCNKEKGGTPDPGMREITSCELAALMGVGWNVGNTLEATGGETSWGNPKITNELFRTVRAAGFTAVRIPVSWSVHITDQKTYKIDNAWMQRVGQVVNYALDNNLYTIINIHWDGGWMNEPTPARQEAVNEKLSAIWTQIANYFKAYDDRLLFAGSNEVHMENDWSSQPPKEYIAVQNSFNQTFVNAVRATGGRNAKRHLIVQSYLTNIELACTSFQMPQDPAADRLMVEVHYYDPYEFALKEDEPYNTQWGAESAGDVSAWGQENWVDSSFGKMKQHFTSKKIPVILGEYGAIYRSYLQGERLTQHAASRVRYLDYVTRAAMNYGMVPFYWDNGATDFRLIDRNSYQIVHPQALEAIVKHNPHRP